MDQHNENSSPIDGDSYPLSHTFYDQQTKSSTIQKFLWKCAGADYKILEHCTYSDHVKYACLGGIVLATGLMAGVSGGYAFYTIFGNKIDVTDEVVSNSFLSSDWFWIPLSIIFGILWGAMIFNLDKYIISSTGKGDGTEKMTWKEFKNAIPRIIMGFVLALTISKPIELRIFKNEIDVEIIKLQQDQKKELISKITQDHQTNLDQINKELIRLEGLIKDNDNKTKELKLLRDIEIKTRPKEKFNAYVSLILKAESELETLKEEQSKYWAELKKIQNTINQEFQAENRGKIKNSDGLLERIKTADKIVPWSIALFITMLFVCLELSPIFFKMMMIQSPYEYLDTNFKDIVLAKYGIQKKSIKNTNGTITGYETENAIPKGALDIYHLSNAMLEEKLRLLNAEMNIKKAIIETYQNKKIDEAKNNHDDFIVVEPVN
ncbi:MAG: DUF4407 domain-containing protein [Alphaproteobacteria bacterium]|nr:DUF4407 domain-containing protein [Alphaproteobacteria bacterium]